jgi:Protein of unknown function (DUF2971)
MRPSRLFKYGSINVQLLENLSRNGIYFAAPSGFNDPFDCSVTPQIEEVTRIELQAVRSRLLEEPEHSEALRRQIEKQGARKWKELLTVRGRKVLDDAIKKFSTSRGVACFSEDNSNLLLWAHYADKYRGVCLEFDTSYKPFEKAIEVRYSRDMPRVSLIRLLFEMEQSNIVETLYSTKSQDWGYEKEWRILHKKAGTVFSYDSRALTRVYFGPLSSQPSQAIVAHLAKILNPDVSFWLGRLSSTEYKVEFDAVEISQNTTPNGES